MGGEDGHHSEGVDRMTPFEFSVGFHAPMFDVVVFGQIVQADMVFFWRKNNV